MIICAVDPSVNNVGIALYDTKINKLQLWQFHPPKLQIQYVASCIANEIFLASIEEKVNVIIIEYPTFQNSAKGHIAAQKGYTLDLAYIAGAVPALLRLNSDQIHLPTPLRWKGNAPKAAVGRRFERRFGLESTKYSDHEFEAAMMIAWFMDDKPERASSRSS